MVMWTEPCFRHNMVLSMCVSERSRRRKMQNFIVIIMKNGITTPLVWTIVFSRQRNMSSILALCLK